MTDTAVAPTLLRLDAFTAAERQAEKFALGDEFLLTLQDSYPHMRAQRFSTSPAAGEQFELERSFGKGLKVCFTERPYRPDRAIAFERGMFGGAALLQVVDSFGTDALDAEAPHGWRVTAATPHRTEPITNLAPMLAPLMLILGEIWQREVRRSRAFPKPGKIIRGREMMNFIVESLALTGWPFTEVEIRAGKAALYAALRGGHDA